MAERGTHWKKFQNKDYLGSWDLEDKEERVLTIRNIGNKEVFNPSSNSKEVCMVCEFTQGKPMILNSTNNKSIQKTYKTPYIEAWIGKQIIVYVKNIKAFGEYIDCLRIRERIPAEDKLECEQCSGEIKGMGKHPASYIAKKTKETYGKALCTACATKLANQVKGDQDNGDK
jgi:hypothetical protein